MCKNTTIDSQKIKQKLKNMAYAYLAKYTSSSKHLEKHLLKKMQQFYKEELTENEKLLIEFKNIINEIINYLVSLGYLNDAAYTKQQSKKFIHSGKSYLHICYKLKEKGIEQEQINNLFNNYNKEDIELLAALRYLKKKSFGAYRKKELDEKQKNKEINALGRNGFTFEIIKKVLKYQDSNEIESLLQQLQHHLDD